MGSKESEEESTYYLVLYRDFYHRELAASNQQMSRCALPVTLATILVGGIGFISRELGMSSMPPGWGAFWWWLLLIAALAASSAIVVTIGCLAYTMWPWKLPPGVLPSEIHDYVKELKTHNAQFDPANNTPQAMELAVNRWLEERYRLDTDRHATRNRHRATWLAWSTMSLAVATTFILLCFGLLCGVYVTRIPSTSLSPNIDTVKGGPSSKGSAIMTEQPKTPSPATPAQPPQRDPPLIIPPAPKPAVPRDVHEGARTDIGVQTRFTTPP